MVMFKPSDKDHSVRVSPSIVIFSVFFLLFLYFLYSIGNILTLFFLGFIVMTALNPFVNVLQNKLRFPRVLAISLMYVLVIAAIAGLIWILVPPLAHQAMEVVNAFNLPWLRDEITKYSFNINEVGALVDQLSGSFNTIYSVVSSTFSGAFTFLTVLVVSLYLMLDRARLHLRVAWFTNKKENVQTAKEFIDSLEYQLGGWIRGQLILMLTIGIVTYLGLTLLSVPYAVTLGLVAGLLEILPNLGPTLAAVPAVILAYVVAGPGLAVITLLFYILVQQLENNFLVPKIMKDNVDVSPLVSIFSILVGLQLAGVIGALLAIPVYIVLRTVYSTWFKDLLLS